jgi:SWI/SNF-related matrix-associated actin-dependent regulator of chromatin subfamily D
MPDAAYWAQQQQQQAQQDAARRRATKPTDLDLPEGSLELAPEMGAMYNALRAYEKRIDAKIMRKMMEYQDRVVANVKQRRRLRLWCWTEVEHQPWQLENTDDTFDFSNQTATYKVEIVGKLLPEPWDKKEDPEDKEKEDTSAQIGDAMDTEAGAATDGSKRTPHKPIIPSHRKASQFIKSISVEYERGKDFPEQYPSFAWKKSAATPAQEASSWSFKRRGDDNLNITITIERDEHPERFSLSKTLSWVVNSPDGTRSEIVTKISEYVQQNKLQDDDDKRTIRCDKYLKEVSSIYKFPRALRV